jgi:hypothetical protein
MQCGALCPMKHVQGFTRINWMLPSGECLRRIAPAAAGHGRQIRCKQKHYQKTLLASNLGTINLYH